MKKTKFIDLTKMDKLRIDEETGAFHPNWDNTILMTVYDAERTFLLTRDGRNLLLTQPLRDVLHCFARDNDIDEYERQAIYKMVGAHKGRGYIAGHHRLVPTHGTTNANVVYYMAHWLDGNGTSANGQLMIASFHGRKRIYRISIDTSLKTFDRLLKAANQAASCQLDGLDWLMYNYGVKTVNKKKSVRYHHNIRDKCRCAHHRIQCAWMITLIRHILSDYLSEEEIREIIKKIKRNI